MKIRPATLNDLPQLSLLFDAYREFYQQVPAPEQAAQFLRERLQQQESVIYVADEKGELLGFVQLYPLFSSTRMKRFWLLNDLFVSTDHRGKGISLALIEQAKELCRVSDSSGMMLETQKSNTIGNQLYPRAGFNLDTGHNFYFWESDQG